MNSPQHFRSNLLQELTGAVERRRIDAAAPRRAAVAVPGRRGLARLSAAVAGVAVLSIGASVLLTERSGSQAFAVTRLPDGRIEISVQEDFDDAAALEAELRAAGVAVDIEEVPASPSMVGKVADAAFLDPGTGAYGSTGYFVQNADSPAFDETLVIDPATVTDVFHLAIGVAAEPGQPYGWHGTASVFAPGEILDGLHCALGDEPFTIGQIAPHLERLGLQVAWSARNREPGERYGYLEPHAGVPPLDEDVEYIELFSPETVTVGAGTMEGFMGADPGEPTVMDPETGEDVPASELPTLSERFPCTPELAARWE